MFTCLSSLPAGSLRPVWRHGAPAGRFCSRPGCWTEPVLTGCRKRDDTRPVFIFFVTFASLCGRFCSETEPNQTSPDQRSGSRVQTAKRRPSQLQRTSPSPPELSFRIRHQSKNSVKFDKPAEKKLILLFFTQTEFEIFFFCFLQNHLVRSGRVGSDRTFLSGPGFITEESRKWNQFEFFQLCSRFWFWSQFQFWVWF